MSNEVPDRQEMFDRAYLGLKSQGWQTSYEQETGSCCYSMEDGRRCAWGWVDLGLGDSDEGWVRDLAADGRGVAARLSPEDLDFADWLQKVHDNVAVRRFARSLEIAMRDFAKEHGLSIPGEGE